jgi:hypothetical protein
MLWSLAFYSVMLSGIYAECHYAEWALPLEYRVGIRRLLITKTVN